MLLLGDGSERYNDLLGEFFMRNVTMGRNGQYFTPEPVCRLMAKITGGNGEGKNVADSCCGSGRMLLAHADSCENPRKKIKKLLLNDIDLICVKMCLLNMLLNSLSGVVTCGNGLIPIWVKGRETFIVSATTTTICNVFPFTITPSDFSHKPTNRLRREVLPISSHSNISHKKIPQANHYIFLNHLQAIT